MYQLEVKRWLVEHRFPPPAGWSVTVDIDAMERARGGVHAIDKAARAKVAEDALRTMGARIGAHETFGRADIVAEHPIHGLWLVEVEGTSSRQKEQAVYSALGQLVLQMQAEAARFMLAVPTDGKWLTQLWKIPPRARELMRLSCVCVSEHGVTEA